MESFIIHKIERKDARKDLSTTRYLIKKGTLLFVYAPECVYLHYIADLQRLTDVR